MFKKFLLSCGVALVLCAGIFVYADQYHKLQIMPEVTGSITIDALNSPDQSVVTLTIDTSGAVSTGTFKTNKIDLDGMGAATGWVHLVKFKVSGITDTVPDSVQLVAVAMTADVPTEIGNSDTVQADTIYCDTGVINQWLGKGSSFDGGDSLKGWIWYEFKLFDSTNGDTNAEGGIPFYDVYLDVGVSPKK